MSHCAVATSLDNKQDYPLHCYAAFQSKAWVRKFSFINQQYSKVLGNNA